MQNMGVVCTVQWNSIKRLFLEDLKNEGGGGGGGGGGDFVPDTPCNPISSTSLELNIS